MKIIVNGRNIHLTDAIKEYVMQKFSRLEGHYDFIQEIHVFLEVKKNPRIHDNQLAEATVHVNGAVLRLESSSETLYASIDTLVDKVERSLSKHKTKLLHRTKASRAAKGESIRRQGFDEALREESLGKVPADEFSEDEIYYIYDDEEGEQVASAR